MTIDEAVKYIEEQKEIFGGIHGEFLDNVLEWLEELEFIRRWKLSVVEDFCKYDASNIDEIAHNARSKAIDDFFDELQSYEEDDWLKLKMSSIYEIAEQIKTE